MSIQDDIFEVEDFVKKNKAAKESFERVYEYLSRLERRVDELQSFQNDLQVFKKVLKELIK